MSSDGGSVKTIATSPVTSNTPVSLPHDIVTYIAGYTNLRLINCVGYIQTFVAFSVSRSQTEFLKVCPCSHLESLARLRQEWRLWADFSETDLPNCLKPFTWEYVGQDGGMMLIYKCEDMKTLREVHISEQPYITEGSGIEPLSLEPNLTPRELSKETIPALLKVADDLCSALIAAHTLKITHGSITAQNIIIKPDGHARLAGWDSYSRLEREDAPSIGLRQSSLPLPYLAPECTGRMNRSVDSRADFYAVGAVLYEACLGFPPFRSRDSLEIIHQHIAAPVIPPHELNPDIPPELSDVILKLLSKNAEDRYQTASGLKSDLALLLQSLSTNSPLIDFRAGLTDQASQFNVSEKLYGREKDLEKLNDCYERVRKNGGTCVVIVSGYSGVGKSRLVNEMQRPVVANRSHFLTGKFDQYKRGMPFFSLIQALQDLIRQVLSESTRSLERWRKEVLRAIDTDASVLVDVIPEVALLLGPNYAIEPMTALGPAERESRFKAVFQKFIGVFTRKGLVLFLDDLQWSSPGELALISSIAASVAESKNRCLLIIGAYRDNEVDSDHHLYGALRLMKDAGTQLVELTLGPLGMDSVRSVIGETLRRQSPDDREMQTLTELVFAKTKGNAFFVNQLLKSLHRQGHISFDFQSSMWKFNLASIEAEDLPPTVVDLLVMQMLNLSLETQEVLKLAACIGTNRFQLSVLALVSERSLEDTAKDLWGALENGLVMPTSSSYKIPGAMGTWLDDSLKAEQNSLKVLTTSDRRSSISPIPNVSPPSGTAPDGSAAITYRFLHDRVQQAAYSLIDAKERPAVHRMIGKRMLQCFSEEQVEAFIYEIVNQLNADLDSLSDEDRTELINLNLRAGMKAGKATAFDASLQYIRTAHSLLKPTSWDDQYDMTLETHMALADALYSSAAYEEAIALCDIATERGRTATDKAKGIISKINCQMGQGELLGSIQSGLQGLAFLEYHIPIDPEAAAEQARNLRPQIMLSPEEIQAMGEARKLSDERLLLVQEILAMIVLPVYMGKPDLLECVCYTSLVISREHGMSTHSAYPLLMAACVLCEFGGDDLVRSYAYGKLSVTLVESEPMVPSIAPAIYEVFAGHISIFHEPLSEALRNFQLCVSTSFTTYDLAYAGFAAVEIPVFSALAGGNLEQAHNNLLAAAPLVRKLKSKLALLWMNIPLQGILNLRGLNSNPDLASLQGEALGGADEIAAVEQCESQSHAYVYYLWRMILAVQFEKTELALEVGEKCEELASSVMGSYYKVMYEFLAISIYLDLEDLSEVQARRLAQYVQRVREFAVTSAGVFQHKLFFLDAELSKCSGKDLQTLDLFDQAISAATSSNSIADAAWYNERAAKWLRPISKHRSTQYIREAYRLYTIWGANAKADYLATTWSDDFSTSVGFSLLSQGQLVMTPTSEKTAFASLDRMVLGQVSEGGRQMSDHSPTIHFEPFSSKTSLPASSPPANTKHVADVMRRRRPSLQDRSTSSQSGGHMGSLFTEQVYVSSDFSGAQEDIDTTSTSSRTKDDQTSSMGSELDLRTVLKASLVISEGVRLEDVILTLMKSVLQTAGADYGVLALIDVDGQLYIETKGLLTDVTIVDHELASTRTDVCPFSMLNFTGRIGETLVRERANDVKFDSTWGRDSYFHANRAKSVLCMPIQSQLKPMGVLYLENRHASNAFTSQRLEVLNLLCTQAAVTIEKARLYRSMELAKKAAEEATVQKSVFLANMSHEIRTPFNAVIGASIFLLDSPLSTTQRDYVETIHNSATLTLNIIDGILDWSKIEQGKIELEREPFSLRDCVESALQVIAEPASNKGLDIGYITDGEYVPDTIIGDMTRFRQVILNLLGNAVKFTHQGTIVIRIGAEELPSDPQGQRYRLKVTVQDTGIGIPESAFARLFQSFSQVDSSTTRKYGGSGLGLAISKRLVNLMGGTIWVESKERQGTSFHFTALFHVGKQQENLVVQGVAPSSNGCLIIHPSPTSPEILSSTLRSIGLRPNVVKDVNGAVRAIGDHPPRHFSVAFIALNEPQEIKDTASSLKKADPALEVILLASVGAPIPDDFHKLNISDYLVKPVRRSRLIKAVQGVLSTPSPTKRSSSAPATMASSGVNKPAVKGLLSDEHPLRILLAEDNPINTKVALQHLKRFGYAADHARDGLEAVEACERLAKDGQMYDVVLMDVQMPRLDGYESTAEILRKWPEPWRQPTIVAMTANAMSSDKEKCLKAGMKDHIPKPILPKRLAAALQSVVPLSQKVRRSSESTSETTSERSDTPE
ncbi:hypothetical protein SAICODRAFT_6009 [Saitoella complicata NRRL Y-17804]|uniref:uncharacterized protein n=1 Tax=Saitoella complicata (strain BCRC 22490 / CBS 7301 / JCM 7358 / NBRC 10748 / NRRL Y-17804) TaxID=698492 RepID=UPI0008682B6D|nr:uncharacterized protein SAICODRAFT_6009 [Saitoella complicata NRRL Y-17804]ODQ54815.1 hypothetical protein SAICODRAFT_6009 [Saitoella complicata NRRL Y-17804]